MCREKRILWLINHTTLRNFEVPLLRSLGFEVYTSKIFPRDEANLSASVDYSYDSSLTIPLELIQEMNQHDFYREPIDKKLSNNLNKYFGTALCAFFPEMLGELVLNYTGNILLRAFGLDQPKTYSYLLDLLCGRDMVEKIKQIQHRFWLAQAYPDLGDIEDAWLKNRTVTLQLGLPESIFASCNTWTGQEKRIFFVCPRILTCPSYYGKIYTEFKSDFGDLPHIIAGKQPVKVEDDNVAGFVDDEVFHRWLQSCRVMFYHSQEPYHLHYHPLEAIVVGMPVIYMQGGVLEKLLGNNQPGACATFKEAREKIIRVLDDDTHFITLLKESQSPILHKFKTQTLCTEWQKNLKEISII